MSIWFCPLLLKGYYVAITFNLFQCFTGEEEARCDSCVRREPRPGSQLPWQPAGYTSDSCVSPQRPSVQSEQVQEIQGHRYTVR